MFKFFSRDKYEPRQKTINTEDKLVYCLNKIDESLMAIEKLQSTYEHEKQALHVTMNSLYIHCLEMYRKTVVLGERIKELEGKNDKQG